MKRVLVLLICLGVVPAFAGEKDDAINNAKQVFEAVRITCSGISDEIRRVANISKANTAIAATGTVAAGGALVAGIKKSQEEEEIDLVVIGSSGKSGIDKFLMGSVADKVVKSAKCSVLVIH